MKMPTILIATALFLICGTATQATVDPDPDQLGIYFDLEATETCRDVVPYTMFSIYLTVTNPSAGSVQGVEFSLCFEPSDPSTSLLGTNRNWFGTYIGNWDFWFWCDNGSQIHFLEPLPSVDSAVPVVRVDYMLMGPGGGSFYLGPAVIQAYPDDLPAYIDTEGNIHPLGVSSGDISVPVAEVNGDCNIVSTQSVTLESVKSLYR